jgi:hypothetical protein
MGFYLCPPPPRQMCVETSGLFLYLQQVDETHSGWTINKVDWV